MLQREGKTPKPVREFGFLVCVEAEEGVSLDHLHDKLAESLSWVEGVGKVEVTVFGDVTELSEPTELTEPTAVAGGTDVQRN